MTPNGQIQVLGFDKVIYTDITSIPGYVGAVATVNNPGSILEGNGITLVGSVTPATNSTVLSAAWDLAGDGTFAVPATIGAESGGSYPISVSLTWGNWSRWGSTAPAPTRSPCASIATPTR